MNTFAKMFLRRRGPRAARHDDTWLGGEALVAPLPVTPRADPVPRPRDDARDRGDDWIAI
ncbi:hypothetical protein ACQQ2N_05835 [Dokdonella sp. MW10]|uniref:hypothetical protein n=1 Tax=Dokdonella sp. MW10 TaxID=2992926 RepID=UPI003F816E1A